METKIIMDETLKGIIDVVPYICISCKKRTIIVKKDDGKNVDSKCPLCQIPLTFIMHGVEYVEKVI